jgi:hypothetical protein
MGLPIPAFSIFRSLDDVDKTKIGCSKYGWTIRTCSSDGSPERGRFYANYLSSKALRQSLLERLAMYAGKEFYLVYASWMYHLSFNVVLLDMNYIIEGCHGSQKGISLGTDDPELSVVIPYGYRTQSKWYRGRRTTEDEEAIGTLLKWLRRIPDEGYYLEVALTTEGQYLFYEFTQLNVNMGMK